MTTQPEALRLAEFYEALAETPPKSSDNSDIRATAAELRRLHAENASLRQIVEDFPPIEAELSEVSDRAHRLTAQRDALLKVVDKLEYSFDGVIERYPEEAEVNAAIKAVEGEKT